MDPLSIAAGAAGLATGCFTIASTIYTWIDDAADVDENVTSLCEEVTALSRVLESVSNAAAQAPRGVVAEIDPDDSLWASVRDTMGDIKSTLDKINHLLAEVQKSGGLFSRGFLKKPTKLIRLNLRLKDINQYRDRIKSYNNAMTSALQMINVCLLIHSNSSQESVFKVLTGLKSQVRRVEFALQVRNQPGAGFDSLESREEDNRITNNLQKLVRVAENFHSSASTVVGSRSTVWGGSIMGDPLSDEQISNIEGWIPPPIQEEDEDRPQTQSDWNSSTVIDEGRNSDSDDDDLEKDLARRLEELAIESQGKGDHVRAESFFRSAIDRGEASRRPSQDIEAMKLRLAHVCMRQEKWKDAEEIISPVAFERKPSNVLVYHGMHALAMEHMKDNDLENANKYCKRALWGKRKVLGKLHPSCWDSLALLASISEARNDIAEAEAQRSFIPPKAQVPSDATALAYLDRSLPSDPLISPTRDRAETSASSQADSMFSDTTVTGEASPSVQSEPLINLSDNTSAPRSKSAGENPFFPPPSPNRTPGAPADPGLPRNFLRPTQGSHVPPPNPTADRYSAYLRREQLTRDYGSQPTQQPTQQQLNPTNPYAWYRSHASNLNHAQADAVVNQNIVPPAAAPKTTFVVAVHYGTESTTVCYYFSVDKTKYQGLINEWPGLSGSSLKSVLPTVLYYDSKQQVVGWGHDIADALAPTGYPKPGITKQQWFNLQLTNPGSTYLSSINFPPLPVGKSAIDVSKDYLYRLLMAIYAELQRVLGEHFTRNQHDIRWCFPTTTTWDESGTRALRAAIVGAGFVGTISDHRLTLLPELEASAHFCGESRWGEVQAGAAIIVAECGGGTVDLAAFIVESQDPFRVKQLTSPTGDSCGSVAVNRNFSNIIRARLKKIPLPEGSKTLGRMYAKSIIEFDKRIKRDFRNNGQRWAVDIGIETEWPEHGIEEGFMVYDNDEVLESFNPVVDRVIDLIKNQIVAVDATNRVLQAIYITGEFTVCEHFFPTIKKGLPTFFQNKLFMPPNADTGVVRGAVAAAKLFIDHPYAA